MLKVATGVAWGSLLGVGIASWILRFDNPTLTETELFIEFWPAWVLMAFITMIACLIIRDNDSFR